MTLRQKLLLAQAPLGMAVLFLGVVAALTISSLGQRADEILRENYRSVLAMQKIKEFIERMDSAALFFLVGHEQRALEQAAHYQPKVEAELIVAERNITEHGEEEAALHLRKAWTSYLERFSQMTTAEHPSPEYYFSDLEPQFQEMKKAADQLLDMNQTAMLRKSDHAQGAAHQMNLVVVVAAAVALLLGLLASSLLTSRLLRPLAALRHITQRVGEGDYEVRADSSRPDEISALAADFNQMIGRLREYKKSSLGKLLQAQRASQAAIESLPDPVFVFGLSGELLTSNRIAQHLFPLDTKGAQLGADSSVQNVLQRVSRHVLGGKGPYLPKGYEEAIRATSTDGDRYLLPRANPVYGEDGAVLGVTVLLQDVTRLRRFDELKNDLVATVAHEFRTPLTSLRMALHLCLEQTAGPITNKQTDLLQAALEDTVRLQTMVDELLDLARIQAGRLEVALRPLSVEALFKNVVDAHRTTAEERQIRLLSEVSPELGELEADAERLQLVLSNLLSNALRYTKDGGQIELTAKPAPGGVRFSVRDQGPGIHQEMQELIFEKFVQLPDGKPGSAGLGLFLAKEIINAHKGKIGVESEPDKGAVFWFTIPLRVA